MPKGRHTVKVISAAGLMVAAIGVGAIVGSPGLASAQVDTVSTTTGDDAATTTLVDDVASTSASDVTLDDATKGSGGDGPGHGDQPCNETGTELSTSGA
jgi:hypothetical protein